MYSKILLLSLLFSALFLQSNSSNCTKKTAGFGDSACGPDCTGTPACRGRSCGHVDNMCYCECQQEDQDYCKTSDLGYKWNNGIKLANGSYALNGTKGDGKQYVC